MSRFWLAAILLARLGLVEDDAGSVIAQQNDTAGTSDAANHTIWLRTPASQWDHAFPLGNGRLGATVFGTINRERIQLNEETLWMGGPRETDNPEALAALPEVRRLLFAGQPREAYALAERKLMGKPWRLESYQSLADLRLAFDHEGTISDYRRELDLDEAVARVSYRVDGVRYTREVFASHPDQVIVIRLTADKPGALSFSTWIDRSQDARTEIVGSDRLNLIGHLAGGKGLAFLASAKITREGGTQETFPGTDPRGGCQCRDDRRRRRDELQRQSTRRTCAEAADSGNCKAVCSTSIDSRRRSSATLSPCHAAAGSGVDPYSRGAFHG